MLYVNYMFIIMSYNNRTIPKGSFLVKFKKLIDEYLDYIEHELRFSPHTVGAYRRDLAKFSSFLRDRGLASFTDARYIDLLCYMKELENSGYANISVIRNVNAARSLFRFLINEDIIEEHVILDPFADRDDHITLGEFPDPRGL